MSPKQRAHADELRFGLAPTGNARLAAAWIAGIAFAIVGLACSRVLTDEGLTGGTVNADADADAAPDAATDAPPDTIHDASDWDMNPDVHESGDTSLDVANDSSRPCSTTQADCDGDASNGCETDLNVDPSSCGACGHGCLGGACGSGRCQPFELATNQGTPSILTLDATHLYWTNQAGEGAVMRIGKQGGTVEVVAVTELPPGGLEVDAQTVYWSEFGEPGSVWRLDKADIGAELPTRLTDGQGFSIALALDNDNVYWSTPGAIRTIPKQGGQEKTLADSQGTPFTLVAEFNSVFWTAATGGQVMGYRLYVPDAGAFELATGQTTPVGLTSDPTYLYWTNHESDPDGGTPAIMMISKLNPAAPVVLADGQYGPTSIKAAGTELFWSNNLDGTIMRMPKIGGTPEVIAEGQASPAGLAVDASAVYWVNREGGQVRGVAR